MREMKDSGMPFCKLVPIEWSVIPNRYLFIGHSMKVGEKSNEYQLLSLTTNGVKEKDINASGGKVPTSYDNYQTVEKGDMIFCLFDLDCSAVFSGLSSFDGMITSAYDVFKPNEKYIDKHFIEYWFAYVFSNRYYKMYSKSIRYTITSDMFKSILSPVPPIEQQRVIGNLLDQKCTQIDALITNQQKQIEKLKAYKQSLITETVTKGLNPDVPMKDSGVEWIGEIPEGWDILQLSSVVTERKHKNIGMIETNLLSLSYGNVIRKNINTTDGLLPESFEGYNIIEAGDIVLRLTDLQNDHKSLRSGLCTERGIITSAYVTLANRGGTLISEYLHYLLHTFDIYKGFYGMGAGVRQGLNFDGIKKILLTRPKIEEQQAIVSYLDQKCTQIDNLISIKQRKIEKLQQYKKSVIYEYVTGKKEVK